MWWAYIQGGAYIRGGLIFGGAYSRRFTVCPPEVDSFVAIAVLIYNK